MAFRVFPFQYCLIILALALAMAVESSTGRGEVREGMSLQWLKEEEIMGMESVGERRSLAGGAKFISYGALKADSIPCNRRGNSYYNCAARGKANPYHRGCNVITHCARITD